MTNINLHDTIVSLLQEKFPHIPVDMTTPVPAFINSESPGPLQFYIDTFISLIEDSLQVSMPDSVFDELVAAAPAGQPLTLGQAMPYLLRVEFPVSAEAPEPAPSFEDTQIELPILDVVVETPVETPLLAAWPFPTDSDDVEASAAVDIDLNATLEPVGDIVIPPASAWPFPVGAQPAVAEPNQTTQAAEPLQESSAEDQAESDDAEFDVNPFAITAAYKYALKYDLEHVLNVLDAMFLDTQLSEKKTHKRVKKVLKAMRDQKDAPYSSVNTLSVPNLDDMYEVNIFAIDASFKFALKYDLEEVLEVLDAIFIDVNLSEKKSKKVVKKALKALR